MKKSLIPLLNITVNSVVRAFLISKPLAVGTFLFLSIILTGIIGSRLLPFNPMHIGRFPVAKPPSFTNILGTDYLGRDVLGQLIISIENSIQIGLIAGLVGTSIGLLIGFTSGYRGGYIDHILRTIIDIFLVIPMLPLLILVSSLVRIVELPMMGLLLGVFAWAWPARQIRAQTLSLKEREFIYISKLSGMSDTKIMFIDIMPHMLTWLGANFFNTVLWAMIAEVGLGILGLGPQHTMTLGMMIYWAMFYAAVIRGVWWWWFPPILTIILILISLFFIHIGVDEVLNPRIRAERG